MAQRLNKNVVVGLTIVGMVLTSLAGVVLVMTLPKTDPKPVADQAGQAAARGEFEQAMKLYQRAAAKARSNKDLSPAVANGYLVSAGDMALAGGDAARAIAAWQDVLLNDPQQRDAHERLIRFFLELAELAGGRTWTEVQTRAQPLCDIGEKTGEKSCLAVHALGRALVEQRAVKPENAEEGRKRLVEAAECDKTEPRFTDGLGTFYVREAQAVADKDRADAGPTKPLKAAAAAYDALIANPSKDPRKVAEAYLDRGRFYVTLSQIKEAEPARGDEARMVLRRVVTGEFPDADAKALADLGKAVELAKAGGPDKIRVDVLVGMGTYWHAKKLSAVRRRAPAAEVEEYRSKARECYKQAIDADYDHYDGYLRLAQSYAEDAEYDQALKILNGRISRGIRRDHYLGWRNRQYMALLRNIAFQMNASKLAALSGDAATVAAQAETIRADMEKLYKETVADLPAGEQEPAALLMKARLEIVKNNSFNAITELEKADKAFAGANLDVKRLLSRMYAVTNAPGLAEEAIKVVVAAAPEDAEALAAMANLIVGVTRADGGSRAEEARQYADRALAVDPTNKEALRAKARAYEQERNWTALTDINQKLRGGAEEDKFGKAMVLLMQAGNPENPQPALLPAAEGLLREVLQADPVNTEALVRLVSVVAQKPERADEVKQLLAKARTALDNRRTATAPSSRPADAARENERLQTVIEQLAITADPSVSREEKVKRMEELLRRNPDPFLVALDLYQLYRQTPDRSEDAMKMLREAHKLKPDHAGVLDQLFTFAAMRKDWAVAEEALSGILKNNLDPSGGHFYRGRLLLARTDKPDHLADAIAEFQAGLKLVPGYVEGYALLGQALGAMNQLDEAVRVYHEAQRRNPQLASAAVGLAAIASMQGDETEYRRNLLLASRLAPEHPWVQGELQNAAEVQDPKAGIARREEIRKSNPKDVENLLRLAQLYQRDAQVGFDAEAAAQAQGRGEDARKAQAQAQARLEDARKTYEETAQAAPGDLRIARLYANFLLAKNPPEPKVARAMLQKLVQGIDPKDAARKASAQLLLAQSLLSEARKGGEGAPAAQDVDAAFVAAADMASAPAVLLEIGSYFVSSGRLDQAEPWIQKAIASANTPESRDLQKRARLLLIQSLLRERDFKRGGEIQKELDAYRSAFPEDPLAMVLQADFYSAIGRDAEAMEYYNDFVNKQSDPTLAHSRRAAAYLRRSQWDQAIADLRFVKQANPAYNNYQDWLRLAQALQNANQTEAAITELQELLAATNSPTVAQQLYGIYKTLQRWDSASSLIDSRAKAQPDNLLWDYLRVDLLSSRKQFEEAIPIALRLVERSKQDAGMVDALLKTYLDAKRHDDVVKFVREKLPRDQQTCRAHLRLASALAERKDVAGAVDAYIAAVEAPDAGHDYIAQSVIQDVAQRLDSKAAVDVLSARVAAQPQQRSAKLLLALLQKEDRAAYAKSLGELLSTLSGSDPRGQREKLFLMRELASACYLQKQFQESRKYYEQVLDTWPNDYMSLNNLAYLLMEDLKDPQASLPYARRAMVILPDNAGVIDTVGWNLVLLGNYEEGIAHLRQAVEKAPQMATLHYHLAEAFQGRSATPTARDKDADLREARAECTRAHELISKSADPEDVEKVLPKVVALGQKLGLTLSPDVKPAKAGPSSAAR